VLRGLGTHLLDNVSALIMETEGVYREHQHCTPSFLHTFLLQAHYNVSYWPAAFFRDATIMGARAPGGFCPAASHPDAAYGPPSWGGDDELIHRPTAPVTNCSLPLRLLLKEAQRKVVELRKRKAWIDRALDGAESSLRQLGAPKRTHLGAAQ